MPTFPGVIATVPARSSAGRTISATTNADGTPSEAATAASATRRAAAAVKAQAVRPRGSAWVASELAKRGEEMIQPRLRRAFARGQRNEDGDAADRDHDADDPQWNRADRNGRSEHCTERDRTCGEDGRQAAAGGPGTAFFGHRLREERDADELAEAAG